MLDAALSSRACTLFFMHDMGKPPLYKALFITSNAVPVQVSFSLLEFFTMPTRERYLYLFPGCEERRASSSRHRIGRHLCLSHMEHHLQPTATEPQHILAAAADACMICALGCDADITASSALTTSGNDATVLPAHDLHRSKILML